MSNTSRLTELSMPTGLAKEVTTQIADAVGDKAAIVALVALTNNTGGTVSNTLADVPATYTEATLANQLASLAGKVNEVIAALKA